MRCLDYLVLSEWEVQVRLVQGVKRIGNGSKESEKK
jgi:hypothetical protein